MRADREFISCSFDVTDEIEVKLYNHVKSKGKGKQSRYIRRLIYNDLMNVQNLITTTTIATQEPEMSDDVEVLGGFL